ncbi:MAG: bifunctional metallophosphatase/5'-nucleotidase [Bryobacterales bacterium]|nr:bifunctional metallophosphatase/5'-nucleotidase [Bryobacterales bacterium]
MTAVEALSWQFMPASFRRLAGGLILLVSLSAQAEIRRLTILHTNDLHAKFLPNHEGRGGFAYMAAAIRKEKQNCSNCLTLHGGDFITGSPVSTIYEGSPVYEIANLMGFDATAIGNHEFDHGWQQISRFARLSRFPLLLSNMTDSEGRPIVERASQVFKVGALRVGVVGGLTMDMPILSTPPNLGSFHMRPLVETLRREIALIRDQCDLIVLLLHVNGDEEDLLLRELPEAAVLVTGHIHRGLELPKVRDGRVLVRVRAFGFELGRLDLEIDTSSKTVHSFTWKRIAVGMNEQQTPDRKVARAIAGWEGRVSKLVDVPIGESKRVYTRPELRLLMAQALKEQMHGDFAFVNDGAMRDELPKGRVSIRDIYNIMPFNNRVLAGMFKGDQLPGVVLEGHTVDPEKSYRFVIQDFTWWHQREQLGLERNLEFPEKGPLFRDLLIDWVKKKKVID